MSEKVVENTPVSNVFLASQKYPVQGVSKTCCKVAEVEVVTSCREVRPALLNTLDKAQHAQAN